MAASIEHLLCALSGAGDHLEELRTLQTAVLALPLGALRERGPELRLDGVFSIMNGGDREQVSLCVTILERILQALDPVHIARNYKEELQRGLHHPEDPVRLLAISQVGRIVESSEAMTEILNNLDLLRQMIVCIGGDKIAVAKEAMTSLSRIGRSSPGLQLLFGSNLLSELRAVMAVSDVVRYRVYELVLEIASVSAESLSFCANCAILPQLLEELTGDDVLVRVACVEMVTSLSGTLHGRQYLAQQGVIDKISNLIVGADADPLSGLYLPGLVKFFGNLALVDSPQQICEHYPAFLKKVFDMATGQEPTMIGVAVDTLGVLASNIEGKQILQKAGSRFIEVFRRIGHHARSSPTELRVRCLDAIASIMFLLPDDHTDDLLAMAESWFRSLSTQPIETFRSMAAQPFPELHCGSLKVFTAIANQPWAQRMMIDSPGFVEYIVDRSVDPDKDSKDAKFELVKALIGAKTTAEVFGNQHYLRLRAYHREGPYYVRAVSTVAVEGAE
ncbi:LOW QUALITY PROTEIN: 26S proteasome non-ATPase regulatory subunit 5 [Hyla sarda]|uniref:LOW QUALITY PROTEIN: 26S proteasome non-ATPase regulatory subunit 5 n=1 Tax=Hyla sarda TaxID=327740 RepID=UPI0024C31461|nr:LOW QUALITY PROTEIN: 26S proteasome non-ATPase regulatory subunit 5 [Hyla sarda]